MPVNRKIVAAITAAILLAAIWFYGRQSIYIQRRYSGLSFDGKACTVIDYTVNGYATSIVFYDGEKITPDQWIREMKRAGRVFQ